MEIKDRVRNVVLNIVEMEAHEVPDSEEFRNLDIDSLMALDMLTDLEREFQIRLPEEVLRHFTSIDAITELLQEKLLCVAA